MVAKKWLREHIVIKCVAKINFLSIQSEKSTSHIINLWLSGLPCCICIRQYIVHTYYTKYMVQVKVIHFQCFASHAKPWLAPTKYKNWTKLNWNDLNCTEHMHPCRIPFHIQPSTYLAFNQKSERQRYVLPMFKKTNIYLCDYWMTKTEQGRECEREYYCFPFSIFQCFYQRSAKYWYTWCVCCDEIRCAILLLQINFEVAHKFKLRTEWKS